MQKIYVHLSILKVFNVTFRGRTNGGNTHTLDVETLFSRTVLLFPSMSSGFGSKAEGSWERQVLVCINFVSLVFGFCSVFPHDRYVRFSHSISSRYVFELQQSL